MKDLLKEDRRKNIRVMINHIVQNKVVGDILDVGVYKGGSSIIAINALTKLKSQEYNIYLYDTYEGMPKPDPKLNGEHILKRYNKFGPNKWAVGTLQEVQNNIKKRTKYPLEKIHYVKGLVEDTLINHPHKQIAYMRLDTDFYESTKIELETLYPKLVSGGVVIIDDYKTKFQGCTNAVNEFFTSINIPLSKIKLIGGSGCFYIKE